MIKQHSYSWLAVALMSAFVSAQAEPDMREWQSTNKQTVEAMLISEKGPNVILQKADGSMLSIRKTGLSIKDQEFIKSMADLKEQKERRKIVEKQFAENGLKYGEQIMPLPDKMKKSTILGPDYLIFIPENYGLTKSGTPIILFLHGAGERGIDINLVKVHGIAKMCTKRKNFPFIAISPQCQPEKWWDPEQLKELLDHVIDLLDVDGDRVYLTGLSMGGFGSWALAAKYPDTFAAVVPICGGGNPADAGKIKDIPIWAFHGDIDDVVNISKSQAMVDALEKLKGNVKFTIYPGVGHNSWTKAYNDPELYDWLLSQKRQ